MHATSGNFNNHIGVPISLARMPELTEFGIFELGMNRPGAVSYTHLTLPTIYSV